MTLGPEPASPVQSPAMSGTKHISTSELRSNLASTLDRVARKRARVVVHRRGIGLAAIVPIEDLRELQGQTGDELSAEQVEAVRLIERIHHLSRQLP